MGTSQVCPLIKQTSAATRIGVFNSYAAGVDEITFQTGREPVAIDSAVGLSNFLNQHDPSLVPSLAIVPESVFVQAPDIHCMKVVKKLSAIWQPVTPGFIIRRRGKLLDPEPTVLVANY
jgi:hypothetical protein